MGEFGVFWDKYYSELNNVFAGRHPFCIWMGKNEDKLPVQYTLRDVIELRKKSLPKGTKCEVYSRVVGYIRPVEQWHDGKQAEFLDRKKFVADDQLEPNQTKLGSGGDAKRRI